MSLQKDILASMSDETLIDVHLVGTDGVEIPCSKFVLSARSEYFKKLFHSGCKEQYEDRSELDCPSEVIQTIVKYCYSDELDLDHIFDGELTEQKVLMLVQLRNAAKCYVLERILKNVETRIGELVFQNKGGVEYVCTILAATEEQDDAFWETLFQFVVMNPVECLHLDQGIIECDPRLLARVLDKVNDPYVVARSLYTWAVGVQENENDDGCEDKNTEVLLSLAKRVDLKLLSTNQLSKIGHCLAFSKDQMLEAYIHHGNLSQVQPPGMSSFPSRNVTVCVTGAGVADSNGLYKQSDFCGQVFAKSGTYGGVQCKFELKWHPAKKGWRISVLPMPIDSTALHMYQATKNSVNEAAGPKQIPFNHWTCLEGAEPAPYVALIEPAKHQQPLSFTFGKSTMPTPPPQFSSTPPAPPQPARTQRRSRGRMWV